MSDKKNIEEIDLLELAKGVWRRRRYIIKFTIISLVIGVVMAISIPKEYTTSVTMAYERSKGMGSRAGGMMDLMALAGAGDLISQSSSGDALTLGLYPEIVSSTPFVDELSKVMVQPKGWDKPTTLYDYVNKGQKTPWWGAVIAFPSHLLKKFSDIELEGADQNSSPSNGAVVKIYPKEDPIFASIRNGINITVDMKNNTIEASVTVQDAKTSAVIADSLVTQLEKYVTDYRTKKAKKDYEFSEKLYNEAKQKYYKAQANYAYFEDNNKNVVRQSANLERTRLQNEQSMAFSIYANMEQQLEMAKIKVQEMTPVVTIIEPAVIPASSSNTGKVAIISIFIFLGLIVGVCVVIVQDMFFKKEEEE